VLASKVRGGFELLDAITIPRQRDQALSEAAAELAQELRKRRISSFSLLFGLARSQVDMLLLELPPAQPAERPMLVRNEVARQLSDLPDEAIVDFNVLSDLDQPGPLRVEAGVMRPDTHDAVQTIAKALRQQPARIVIRSLAVASLFRRQVKKLPECSVLMNLMQSTADVSVMQHDRITFTRSVHITWIQEDTPDVPQLADEIRRTLFVAPQAGATDELGEEQFQHVYMFADLERGRQLVESLADELQLTVSLLDPLAGIEIRSGARPQRTHRFAALLGMLWDYLDAEPPIDFANPKRTPEPPRVGRKIAVYAALALAAITTIGVTLRSEVADAEKAASEMAAEVKAQDQLRKKLRAKTAVLDVVQRWEQSELNWLEELRELSTRFPEAEQAVVQRITMAPSSGNRGLISMSIRVRDPEIIADLENSLRDKRHQVSSKRISQATSNQAYAVQFETSVVVTPASPALSTEPPTDTQASSVPRQ
jgi:hypothetical protein